MTDLRDSSSAQVVVAATPHGVPTAASFTLTSVEMPIPSPGHLLLRVEALSLDPYLRSLLGPGHLGEPAVGPGAVMPGRAVATVIGGEGSGIPVGTRVMAETGWREHAVLPAGDVTPLDLPPGVPASAALGILGMPGLTAWAAHVRHLRPQIGDTVVISAATGGVGSLAGQLATIAGARAVAVVGSRSKEALARELGYTAVVVRTEPDWTEQLRAACPTGIDAYLHLGDQATLDGVAEHLAIGARISLCGVIDQSNGAPPTRLRAGALMTARASAHGMVVYDHQDLAAEHVARVGALLQSGSVRQVEDRRSGLAAAPAAFADLMSGRNHGKVVIDVHSPDPTRPHPTPEHQEHP